MPDGILPPHGPLDDDRRRLGHLLVQFAEARKIPTHRGRETGDYEFEFLIPELRSMRPSKPDGIYELLELLARGYER